MKKPKSTSQAERQELIRPDELDPIIEGLLQRLPAGGDYWPKAERKQWLQLMELTLDLIYVEEETPSAATA